MAEPVSLTLANPRDTEEAGRQLALAVLAVRPESLTVFLEGELGAGKTTLARGFLAGLGHTGRVPSPTYTLVEPYAAAGYRVFHVDLYRIQQPRQVAELGLTDQLTAGSVALIEWPDHGAGQLPPADLTLQLEIATQGRLLRAYVNGAAGAKLLTQWQRRTAPNRALTPT